MKKKQAGRKWLAACGLIVAIAAAVLIAIYVSNNNNVSKLNYGNTIVHPQPPINTLSGQGQAH